MQDLPPGLEAVDTDGNTVNLKGLATTQAVILVFLRHYG